jgi:very-short-patch-repair endonuclease
MAFRGSLEGSESSQREDVAHAKRKARELRSELTDAEEVLWELLRNRKLLGMKFRRQVRIDRYVADFYCHERRLIVELDGEIHSLPTRQAHDASRDAHLRSLGLRLLRLPNEAISKDPDAVLRQIREAASRPVNLTRNR